MVFCENIMPEVITNGDTGYPFTPGNGGELYDLENDPGEWNNLFKSQPARVNEIKGAILDWLSTADEVDQVAKYWDI